MDYETKIQQLRTKLEQSRGSSKGIEDELKNVRHKQREEQWRKDAQEREEFKTRIATEHGVLDNPKLDRCFEIAWDMGHSSGYGEIENYFDTLVDLIKD